VRAKVLFYYFFYKKGEKKLAAHISSLEVDGCLEGQSPQLSVID
jgi:hypothetical protein